MKEVTFLLNTFPSISETFILNQVVGLKKAGFDVSVISLKKPDMSRVHPDFYTYHCDKGLTIINLPSQKIKRLFLGGVIGLKLLFLSPCKMITALNRKKYQTASSFLKNLYVLNKLRGKHIPLLHAHFGPNGLVGTFLKDIGTVEKLVVTYHGSDINSYPRRYGEKVYASLYEKADLITANTNFTKGKITANGGPAERIRILPVGLHTSDYPLRKDPPLSTHKHDYRILTVGRLAEKKGYPWAIRAVEKLLSQYPELTYHIVGDGPLRGELEEMIMTKGLSGSIILRGRLNADDVRQEMNEAHIFVLSSVTAKSGDMEGQGLVLQEAQAMGVPVVSTLHNGIPDGVLDGKSGFLVPEKDSVSLSEKIEYLLENSEERIKMGAAGHNFVRENYDMTLLTDRLIVMYNDLLK